MIQTAQSASFSEQLRSIDIEDVLSSADFLPPSSPTVHGAAPPSWWRSQATVSEGRLAARPAAPVADPLLGMIVADRYRIVEAVGRGGMGVVYKVQHTRIGKLLAMKVLTGEMSQNPEVVRRFKREALAVSKLESPNTVQVFDFGVSEGLTYLVMELVSGESLGSAVRADGPMPFLRLGRIVTQVCSSLAEAHRKGIVHRDIKPENIMLVPTADGADLVKVLDFGLAKLREVEGAEDVTCRGVILGTPSYMAPEQIQGHEVDARTDVYSVGALMYRLATGHPPFRAGSPLALLDKHLHEKPIPPADRCPELAIPLGLSRLVMRALRKDPADRFQRVEDLQALLVEELRTAGSSSVESLLDPRRLRRIVRADQRNSDAGPLATRDEVDAYERGLRRTRYGLAGAAGALALAAAGAGASVFFAREARDARSAGVEIEPNDTPAEASAIALGRPVSGHLGKRIDEAHGDRDFYAFELPARAQGEKSFLRLRVSALPGVATCTMLYRRGFPEAVGQYCAGRPGRDLDIPAMALDPGSYLVAVLQDMDPYGGAPPYVQETISDTYTLLAESTIPDPEAEIEPNDHVASATPLVVGRSSSARIGWARDQDFFCLREPAAGPVSGRIRWRVRAGLRTSGALEATPMRGEEGGAPVRIHLDETGKRSESDVTSPWQSDPVAADGAPRCLRVRLDANAGGAPAGAGVPYAVEAEAVL